MYDKVRYDIYASNSPNAQPSMECMDGLDKNEQVIVILGARVKPSDPEIPLVYKKFKDQSTAIYYKDRRNQQETRRFVIEDKDVLSDTPAKKLRSNKHIVITRIR